MKIGRRVQRPSGPVDERYVLLRFSDGAVIDGRNCPAGILARNHWRIIDGVAGAVNTQCACPRVEVAS